MKKILLAALSFVSLSASVYGDATLTLDQLRAKCLEYQNNSQIRQDLDHDFSCTMTEQFWTQSTDKCSKLVDRTHLSMKAYIKGGASTTDWFTLDGSSSSQSDTCSDVTQWRQVARYHERITSCAQLELITSEEGYCRAKLKDTWDTCNEERSIARSQKGPFQAPQASLCTYEPTGAKRECQGEACEDTCPRKQQQCQQQCQQGQNQQQCQQQCQQQQCQQDQNQQQSSSSSLHFEDSSSEEEVKPVAEEVVVAKCDTTVPATPVVAPAVKASPEVGAKLYYPAFVQRTVLGVTVPRTGVRIETTPVKGSWLDRAGLKKGQIIFRINGNHIIGKKEVEKVLKKLRASAAGKIAGKTIVIEYHESYEGAPKYVFAPIN